MNGGVAQFSRQLMRSAAFGPSLKVLATTAVNAARAVRQHGLSDDEYARRDAARLAAADAFMERLWIEGGISKQLAADLVSECVL